MSPTRAARKRAAFDHPLLLALNPAQREAVETLEGPLLVLAGAGTGKTRVITTRIAYLMARSVAPSNILAVTFTNKAAGEMKERVKALAGARARELTIGTFHAFCVRLLRAHGEALGLSRSFTICDSSDQLSAVKSVMRELRVHETTMHPSAVLARLSLAKNRMETPSSFLDAATSTRDELVAAVWERYQQHLTRSRALDFDDLLLETVRLLKEHPKVRGFCRKTHRYVLVDEYQDTNHPQYEIMREIAAEHSNVCVVGDDDQSIYGFRGADIQKILGFHRDFKGAKVVRLETNYRSTRPILEAANAVIRHNSARHEKSLVSAVGEGAPVRLTRLADEMTEAQFVVEEILKLVRRDEGRLSDVAVLFRTQVQPRPFEAELRAKGLPYVLVGGMSFFDRKEVRDVVAFLKVALNPDDEAAFLRVVNTPPRGIGKTTIDRVLAFATAEGISASRAFERATEIKGVSEDAAAAHQEFRRRLARVGMESADPVLRGWGLTELGNTFWQAGQAAVTRGGAPRSAAAGGGSASAASRAAAPTYTSPTGRGWRRSARRRSAPDAPPAPCRRSRSRRSSVTWNDASAFRLWRSRSNSSRWARGTTISQWTGDGSGMALRGHVSTRRARPPGSAGSVFPS